jgi:hypothetical protein
VASGLILAAPVTDISGFKTAGGGEGKAINCTAETGGQITGEEDAYDPNVYFIAYKKDVGHKVAIGGEDADYISMAEADATVCGVTAGGTTEVFTVRPKPIVGGNGEMLDTQFEGGEYNFTLTDDVGTSAITLTVEPHLTGVAVFKVNATTEEGLADLEEGQNVLERLTGIKECEVTGSATTIKDSPASEGNFLLSAIAYVDQPYNALLTEDDYAKYKGGEFLIRVEENEALPRIGTLSCTGQLEEENRVTVRLRGAGGEKTIRYKDNNDKYFNMAKAHDTYIGYGGFIEVGYQRDGNPYFFRVTLALENNITISGKYNGNTNDDSKFTNSNTRYVIRVNTNARLIMRNGSKLTNFYSDSGAHAVVYIKGKSTSVGWGIFEMQGGSITGNVLTNMTASTSIIYVYSSFCEFKKNGGIIDNSPNNTVYHYNTGYEISKTAGAWTYK